MVKKISKGQKMSRNSGKELSSILRQRLKSSGHSIFKEWGVRLILVQICSPLCFKHV